MSFQTIELTTRDREVIETLALRVRILTADQVARTWWPEAATSRASARRRLLRLVDAGHLDWADRLARPELELTEPLATWRPGRRPPSAAAISARGRSRFRDPPRTHSVFWASASTMRSHVGVTTRAPRPNEITHDLHLAQVFLRLRAERPHLATAWQAEWMPKPPQRRGRRPATPAKKPDALVRTPEATLAIEFVGHYTPAKISEFHEYCVKRAYWYELW